MVTTALTIASTPALVDVQEAVPAAAPVDAKAVCSSTEDRQ